MNFCNLIWFILQAIHTTEMLDCSEPDIMGILKEMAYEMQNQSAHNLSDDTDVQDFMALLCQNIDSRNILTPAELSE